MTTVSTSESLTSLFAKMDIPIGNRKRKFSDGDHNDENTKKLKQEDKPKEEEEEFSCPICFEPWTTEGDHQVISLKCGHLFGFKCVTDWMKKTHNCPQCMASAEFSDIRRLFVSKITAADKLHSSWLQKEEVKQNNPDTKPSVLGGLGSFLSVFNRQNQSASLQSPPGAQFKLQSRINLGLDNDRRVFDFCPRSNMVAIGAGNQATKCLSLTYGVEIVVNNTKTRFLGLHTEPIRDLSFRPETQEGTLLSLGNDKNWKLTCLTSKTVIINHTSSVGLARCCWNQKDSNRFYVGTLEGQVSEFDVRFGKSPVQQVVNYRDGPIVGLQFMGQLADSSLQGLLVGSKTTLNFVEETSRGFVVHGLPHLGDGLMDLSLHSSGKFLGSYNPTDKLRKSRLEICQLHQQCLENVPRSVWAVRGSYFEGDANPKLSCRNALICRPDGSSGGLLACTADHAARAVSIYDESTKRKLQVLPCFDEPVDIKLVKSGELGVLTQKEYLLYKWVAGP